MVNTFTLPLFLSKPYPRFWGASHPDLEIRGRLGLKKKFFRSFGPQFGLKMGWGGGRPGPGYATAGYRIGVVFQL